MSESPEQEDINAELPRAGLLRRLAALLYDAFLVAAIWMLLGYIVVAIFGTESNQVINEQVQTDPVQDFVLFTLMVASCTGFYLYFWLRSGQTLGMLAWRLRLENIDGTLVTPTQGLKRFIAAWPAFFCLGIGYFWLYFDANRDTLHDRLCKTRVVLVPRSKRPLDKPL